MLFAMPSRRSSALIFVAIYRTSFSRSLTTDPALQILRRRAEKDWDFPACGLVPKISEHNEKFVVRRVAALLLRFASGYPAWCISKAIRWSPCCNLSRLNSGGTTFTLRCYFGRNGFRGWKRTNCFGPWPNFQIRLMSFSFVSEEEGPGGRNQPDRINLRVPSDFAH